MIAGEFMMKESEGKKVLSIIIPAYNEAATVKELLERVTRLRAPFKKEVIVVDDASTDATARIAQSFGRNVKLVRHSMNQGKGAAIRTGIKHCTGLYTIIQDADLEYDPKDYLPLWNAAVKHGLQVVYGSRFSGNRAYPIGAHGFGNKFLTFMTNLLFSSKLTDMETCYKLMQTSLLKSLPLKASKFDFEPEVTSLLLKRGIRIREVPITYHPRTALQGKKIHWKDGLQALRALFRERFS